RNVSVSTLPRIPPMRVSRSARRRGPSRSAHSTTAFQVLASRSNASRAWQSARNTTASVGHRTVPIGFPTVPPAYTTVVRRYEMRIGMLGTGGMAAALGAGWARAGHDIMIAGRDAGKAAALAGAVGGRSG